MVKQLWISLTLACICWAQNLEIKSRCSYTMGKRVFDCVGSQNGLENVTDFLTPTTTMLVIRNSDDIYFSSYYHNLTNYQNVIGYDIFDNGNLRIDPFAFCCMTNLRYLTIESNYLPVVKDNSFRGLDILETLTLSQNNITVLEKDSFVGLSSLEKLVLTRNKLKNITPNLFKDVTNLKFLYLANNDISVIEKNSFVGLARLETLDLRVNKLQILDGSHFDVFLNLKELLLSYNKIERIQGYLKLSKLNFLSLDNNKLVHIENDCFKYLHSTGSIDVSKNELKRLTSHPFRNLSSLVLLNLRGNDLNKTDFDDLKQVLVVV